jgi:hypothetical protein
VGWGVCAFRAAVGVGERRGSGDERAGVRMGKWRRGKPTCFCMQPEVVIAVVAKKASLHRPSLFPLPPLVLSSSSPSRSREGQTPQTPAPFRCRIGLPILLRG